MDESKKAFFTEEEWKALEVATETGTRPISKTLQEEMYNLFLEGYDAAKIAKQNKGYSEIDILMTRYRGNWDENKLKYQDDLQEQILQKLKKTQFESLEFLTNMLSVLHKDERQKMLTYLQTGRKEDRPEIFVSSIGTYKSLIETIQKLTGEDKVQKHEIKSDIRIIASKEVSEKMPREVQSNLLKQLLASKGKK